MALRRHNDDANEFVVEAMRVCFQRNGMNIRELERTKLKYGYCIIGLTCLQKAVKGAAGGMRGCAHHLAAKSEGVALYKQEDREATAYGARRKAERERERLEAEAEAERVARNEKVTRRVKGKSAA